MTNQQLNFDSHLALSLHYFLDILEYGLSWVMVSLNYHPEESLLFQGFVVHHAYILGRVKYTSRAGFLPP